MFVMKPCFTCVFVWMPSPAHMYTCDPGWAPAVPYTRGRPGSGPLVVWGPVPCRVYVCVLLHGVIPLYILSIPLVGRGLCGRWQLFRVL